MRCGWRTFDIADKVKSSGEYVLGSGDSGGSHAVNMIDGVLKPANRGRELKPGHGHEDWSWRCGVIFRLRDIIAGRSKKGRRSNCAVMRPCRREMTAWQKQCMSLPAATRMTDITEEAQA